MMARTIDQELVQELDAHLELLTAEYIRRGMMAEEARRCARLQIGGMEQLRERHREVGGLPAADRMFVTHCERWGKNRDLRWCAS